MRKVNSNATSSSPLTHLFKSTHTRAHTLAHKETPTNTHVCLHVRMGVCVYVYPHTHTHTHPHLRTHHVNICMRTRKYYQLNETEAASHNAPTTMCKETKISNHQSIPYSHLCTIPRFMSRRCEAGAELNFPSQSSSPISLASFIGTGDLPWPKPPRQEKNPGTGSRPLCGLCVMRGSWRGCSVVFLK